MTAVTREYKRARIRMTQTSIDLDGKVALVTGAARRIGAEIAETLHGAGMNVAVHCRNSPDEAGQLAARLNRERPDSACVVRADLLQPGQIEALAKHAVAQWGRLDTLVNNASTFYPTPIDTLNEAQWNEILGTNLKAALFLSRQLLSELRRRRGCIVNIGDIHAGRPLKGYMAYSIAKAGVHMLTKSLARELAPEVRCNAVAPGALLWPEDEHYAQKHAEIISRTALKREGSPRDAAAAVLFLVRDAGYVTGQIIAVDGGRTLGN